MQVLVGWRRRQQGCTSRSAPHRPSRKPQHRQLRRAALQCRRTRCPPPLPPLCRRASPPQWQTCRQVPQPVAGSKTGPAEQQLPFCERSSQVLDAQPCSHLAGLSIVVEDVSAEEAAARQAAAAARFGRLLRSKGSFWLAGGVAVQRRGGGWVNWVDCGCMRAGMRHVRC